MRDFSNCKDRRGHFHIANLPVCRTVLPQPSGPGAECLGPVCPVCVPATIRASSTGRVSKRLTVAGGCCCGACPPNLCAFARAAPMGAGPMVGHYPSG